MAWYWHVPTAVAGGEGAIDGCGPLVRSHGRRALVVTDTGVRAGSRLIDVVGRALAGAGVAVDIDTLAGPPTLATVGRLAERARAAGATVIVAIGGGSVLDPAKLAAAALRHADLLEPDTWSGGGLVEPALSSGRRGLPVVAVPTTVGTGSEVSPSACIVVGGAKKLFVHPAIRPTAAVLDPQATAGTPRPIVVEGAFEVLLRALGQRIGEDGTLPLQDAMAADLARRALAEGDLVAGRTGAVDAAERSARHRLAMASAATHAGWALCGRDRFAHRLWYLANEWAHVLGVSKVAATAALAVPYLTALQRDLDPIALDLFGAGIPLADGMAGVIDRWGLPRSLADLGADHDTAALVTGATWAAWGPPSPALAGFDPATVLALFRAALDPARRLEPV